MDAPDRLARIEQQLRDERRLRDAAERKAADQATKARVWRDRAEARTARIERLVAERDRHGRVVSAVRKAVSGLRGVTSGRIEPPFPADGGTDAGTHATLDDALDRSVGESRRPALPHVQMATLVADPSLRRVCAETTQHDIGAGDGGLFEADVVLVEQAVLRRSPDHVRERFDRWVALDARQPLVWVGDEPPDTGPVVVATPDGELLRPTFDPVLDTPVGRPSVAAAPSGRPPVASEPLDAADPVQLAAAARAEPVVGADDPVREGDRRRRLVWARHTPAAVAHDLVAASGWLFEDPTPEVAAVLVSNRPDDLARQLVAMLDQQHPRLRLQVGCHGFSSRDVALELDRVREALAVDVVDLPASRELGWCLNRVIETTGSPVLAKIDDDDHYGPGYLVDALQAMEYADAAIVGRVCSFTHLEDRGETVLRRLGDEEMHYDGTLVGATMVFTRGTWERGPFPHKTLAEDVGLQRAARSLGGRVYVASRWDFVYRRRAGGNTWRVPDEHFLSNATHAWDGWEPHRADLAVR